MNNQQLDIVLSYLNEEASLEDTYEALNEGKLLDKILDTFHIKHKAYTKKKLDQKKFLLDFLFGKKKDNQVDTLKFKQDWQLEKQEGEDDLYICKKYSIAGHNPYIKLANGISLAHLAAYPDTLKMFMEEAETWSKLDLKEGYLPSTLTARLHCDVVELPEICKNIKMEAVVITKGWNDQGYSFYLCQYVVSLKCTKMKALKYHTYGFRLDTNTGWTGRWFDFPPKFLHLDD